MTKPSLLIVGYYHLEDGFLACSNYLKNDYDIYFFPLSHYHDSKYDIRSELVQYINGDQCEHYECGLKPHNNPINVVLIWHFKYFIENHARLNIFVNIKNEVKHDVLYLGYNWDPQPPEKGLELMKILFIRLLDYYLTCDGREISILKDMGEYNYVYCPSGYDPTITHYIEDNSYECDISIVCTNLYYDYDLFPLECVRVHRGSLVDLVYAHRSEFKFHIYGPSELGEKYPECYRGYIKYNECPRVFSNSKINLCIHATSHNNYGTYSYFSERLPQILGSRGLLYCDTVYEYLLKPDLNYILADDIDPLGQIRNIINNYHHLKYCQIKDNGYELATKHLTWNNMRQKISLINERKYIN